MSDCCCSDGGGDDYSVDVSYDTYESPIQDVVYDSYDSHSYEDPNTDVTQIAWDGGYSETEWSGGYVEASVDQTDFSSVGEAAWGPAEGTYENTVETPAVEWATIGGSWSSVDEDIHIIAPDGTEVARGSGFELWDITPQATVSEFSPETTTIAGFPQGWTPQATTATGFNPYMGPSLASINDAIASSQRMMFLPSGVTSNYDYSSGSTTYYSGGNSGSNYDSHGDVY